MSTEMKKLIVGGTEYEIVDDAGRTRITALEQGGGTGLTQTEKDLLLTLFEKAAYADNDASEAFSSLSELWEDSTVYHAVTWSGTGYTKGNTASRVEDGESFTSTITANTGFNLTAVTVTMGGTEVQGAWSSGTVTIPNVTGDIVITVTTSQITVSSISAVYTQSGTVYDTDSLDSLKSDLVVTATFSDSTTGVISAEDYTLSGTLTAGTSTITVTYAGLTDTFSVTVSHMDNSIISWDFTQSLTDSKQGLVATLGGTATIDSSGLHINSASAYAILGKFLAVDQSYEIDITDMDASSWTNTNGRLFIWYNGGGGGLVYHNDTGTWSIYRSEWYDPLTLISSREYFKNSTVKITVTAGSTQYKKVVTVYKDGTEIMSQEINNDPVDSTKDVYLGSTATSAFSVTITGFRVYSGV